MEKYVYDLEVYPNYCLGYFLNLATNESVIFELSDEINQVSELCNFLEKGNTLIGYNNHRYDNRILKFIKLFGTGIKTADIYNLSATIIEGKTAPIFQNKYNSFKNREKNIEICGTSIDLSIFHVKKSLKELGVSLGHERLQELPFDPHKPLNASQIDIIKDYCRNDIEITKKLYESCKTKLEIREHLENRLEKERNYSGYRKKFVTLSDPQLAADSMALSYCYKEKIDYWSFTGIRKPDYQILEVKNLIFPDINFQSNPLEILLDFLKTKRLAFKEEIIERYTFEGVKPFQTLVLDNAYSFKETVTINKTPYTFGLGGLHSDRSNEIFKADAGTKIIDADVASYYPNISIQNNIKPDFLNDSWLEIYKIITAERIKAKEQGDKLTADALKIIINSLYGKYNEKYFYAYDPKTAYRITLNGQLYLLKLIESLELNGYEVISANTDGITYLDRGGK